MFIKILSVLALTLATFTPCLAQQAVEFNGQPLLARPLDIRDQTYFYEDTSGDTLSFSEVKKRRFVPLPKAFMQLKTARHPLIVNWLRFRIRNTSIGDTLTLVFACNTHVFTQMYSDDQSGGKPFSFEQTTTDSLGIRLKVPPGKTNTYYIRVVEFIHYLLPLSAVLHTPFTYLRNYQQNSADIAYLFLVMCMALGCLLFMGIYAAYQLLLTRDIAMAFYTAYVFSAFYIWLIITDQRFSLEIFDPLKWNYNIPLSSGIVFFYALFIAYMLNIKQSFPRRWKVLQCLLCIILLETALEIYETSTGGFIFRSNAYYLYVQNLPNLLTNLYLIWLLIVSKGVLKRFLLSGMICLFVFLIVFTNLTYYIYIVTDSAKLRMFANFPPLMGMMGVVTESVCFAFALAYRAKLIQDEKNQLQVSYARSLNEELEKRTLEMEEQNNLLEAQRTRQLETAFEKKIAETEMTALRAQMNPHFIFNCLNSIKLYTLENDSQAASDYLTTFSRLIRLVLENSRSERITLENELETLRLYIELEVMRFKEKVSYHIVIADGIDAPYVEVPPLLLQPYVENAIWHGLMHKEFGGIVHIGISQPDEHLLHIEITDNGVGREKAAEYKSKSIIRHKSFGLKMTGERIQVINELYDIKTEVRLLDLVDDRGVPAGTRVIIDIPI